MREYHIEIPKLLDAAKNIFGEIVVSVHIKIEVDEDENETVKSSFRKEKSSYENMIKQSDKTYISTDGVSFVVLFTNGKAVNFSNSEWASISECPDFNPLKIKL